jgi:hypothetical protein
MIAMSTLCLGILMVTQPPQALEVNAGTQDDQIPQVSVMLVWCWYVSRSLFLLICLSDAE